MSILFKKTKPNPSAPSPEGPDKDLRKGQLQPSLGQSGVKVAPRLMGSALSTFLLCSWQEEPTNARLLQALLYLRERRGRAVDMQGLLAATEAGPRLCEAGRCAWGGCVRHADTQCSHFLFKSEQGWLGTRDPQGT